MIRFFSHIRSKLFKLNINQIVLGVKHKSNVPTVQNYVDKDVLLGRISALDAQFKTGKHDPNWMSFGYDDTDQFLDTWKKRIVLFFGYSIAMVGVIFVVAYYPDPRLYDWAYREALFEIEHRERLGLPLVDINLIPIERIVLPDEEQIGDTKIII